MKSQGSQSRWILMLGASLMAASLPLTSTNCAYANADRAATQLNNANARENWRASRQEARDLSRDHRAFNQSGNNGHGRAHTTIGTTLGISNVDPIRTHIERGNTAVLFPGQVSTFHTRRPPSSQTTYINDGGKTRALARGVSLDLSSTVANITVGENLLDGSTTIQVGDQSKTIHAGSKVTAAEYAALNQKLATGSQALYLSSAGAAEGGNLNLNLVSDDGATIRASELVVPKNVTVTGDFARAADGVRVTKDIVNYGSLLATSTNADKNTAVIGARDINNEQGASIASQSSASNPNLNLALRADRDLNNQGSITSAGSLELSAGHAINNQGLASATNGDITLTTAADTALQVNSYNGTLSALNGAINVREAGYTGTADSTIYGGNFLSKELNVNAGQGTANLVVNEVTGVVNTSGAAAHVSANTSDLVLGKQCLTGDPTYFNTGNIILGGDINVDEDLAIIAGGNITTNQTSLTIRTRGASNVGHDIYIIAGANITAGSGQTPGTLPAQNTGSVSGNATTPVTVSGASATGGNVDFTNATSSLFIDASSSTGNADGGNVTWAAFASGGGANGRVLTNIGTNHQIFANGDNTGNNGNVSLIAGATSGQAIQIGAIHAAGGTGQAAGTGDVVLSNTQPKTSDNNPITFGTSGNITSGNTIVPSSTVGGGSVTAGISGAQIDCKQTVTITSGAATDVGKMDQLFDKVSIFSAGDLNVNIISNNSTSFGTIQLISQGNITLNDQIRADDGILMVAGKDLIVGTNNVSIKTNKSGDTGNISLIAGAQFTVNANSVTISGPSATGGSILFDNPSAKLASDLAAVSVNNGNGGDINLIAYAGAGKGEIHIPLNALSVRSNRNGTGLFEGDIAIIAGANTSTAITMDRVDDTFGGADNGTGSIYIASATPGSGVDLATTLAGFAGVSSGTFLGGAISPLGGINLDGQTISAGGAITYRAGAGGVVLQDVIGWGNMSVESLGDILNQGGFATIAGAADGQNTLLWTALGNISFSARFNVHATGGGSTNTGGGGGIALIAGGTVQSVVSPFGFTDTRLESNSGTNGGNITVISGAAFTRNVNDVAITGASGTGGSIRFDGTALAGFTGSAITLLDAHSQGAGFNGGDITLISYGNIGATPPLYSVAGNGGGVNGNVLMVTPGTLNVPGVDFSAHGGSITIRMGTPSAGSIDTKVPASITSFGHPTGFQSGPLSGQPYSGTLFNTTFGLPRGVKVSIAAGGVTFGNIDVSSNTAGVAGGSVTLQSSGNIVVGNIDVSNTSASGNAGVIDITSNSGIPLNIGGGGVNGTGTLTANASATVGDGGEVHITNTGSGGVTITTAPSQTVTNGNGATLDLDAGTGTLTVGPIGININRSGVGANRSGGEIDLTYGTLAAGAGNIVLTANGTGATGVGGTVSVQTTLSGAAGNINIGTASGQFNPSTSGGGGDGTMNFTAGGILTLTATGSLNTADNINLSAASNVVLNSAITTRDIRVSSGGTITAPSSITADPITMISTGNIAVDNMTAAGGILIVSGGNITPNTNFDILANGPNGGNVVIVAGASFIESPTDVTITGASATGGNINFTGGTVLNAIDAGGIGNGGNVTLMAFETGAGTGRVLLPVGSSIGTTANLGLAGKVVVIGSANSGAAVGMGAVANIQGTPGTGSITIAAAAPVTGTAGPILKSDASYTGTFTGGAALGGSVTTANLSTPFGAVSVTGGGDVTVGNINTAVPTLPSNGGAVTLTTGSAGSLTAGNIVATGFSTGSGAFVNITAGSGAFTLGTININGGSVGAGGAGGQLNLFVNTASALNLNAIQAIGNGTSGHGGVITVVNNGLGGINLVAANYNVQGAGAGGSLFIDANSGSITTVGPLTLSENPGSAGFNNGIISLSGDTLITNGNILLQANTGVAGTGGIALDFSTAIVTNGGNFTALSGNDVLIFTGVRLDTLGATGGSINVSANGSLFGPTNMRTNSTAGNNNGGSVTVTATNGQISVGSISADPAGTGNGGAISLTSGGTAGITAGSLQSTGTSPGSVTLSATNGSINLTGPVISSPINGVLNVSLLGGTPGNATIAGASNVSTLNTQGGGTVTFDNGFSVLNLNLLGATQSVVLSTTHVNGMTFTSPVNTTGTITLNTPRVVNSQTVSAASILIQNLSGNLFVDAGGGGTFTATTPPAGPPGTPSVPPAIVFNTANGATLSLTGNMTFNGDLALNNPGGTTISNNLSLFAGNNNVRLNTNTWTQAGTGNITGNNFLLVGVTYINSDGDFTLPGNTTFVGRDLAIVAKNNIDLSNFTIDLSSATSNGGNLTLIAGYDFNPTGGGQQNGSSLLYTLVGPDSLGGNITGSATIKTSATGASGNGGNILAVANGGSTNPGTISFGNIFTTSANGAGGDVKIIGSSNITTGNITSTGLTSGGDVTLSMSNPQVSGATLTVQNGVLSGGTFIRGATTAGALNVNGFIDTGDASILIENGFANMLIAGNLIGHDIKILASKTSLINLTSIDTIAAAPDGSGNGGSIEIVAGAVSTFGNPTLTLDALGFTGGTGGSVSYSSGNSFTVGPTGAIQIDVSGPAIGGVVDVRSDHSLTVQAGGITAGGLAGNGATIRLLAGQGGAGTLTLNDTTFLANANAVTNGNGGEIDLEGPLMVFTSSSGTPLALSANGAGSGNGGLVQFINQDPTATFFGVPVKAPKPPVNFLAITAESGGLDGDGGSIIVRTGGNITVTDTSLISAGPQSGAGNHNGGNYILEAGNVSGKGGALVITGNINADAVGSANGGTINLISNNKKVFQTNLVGKTPKNGISGLLSATSLNGEVDVRNKGGGVSYLTNNAITAGIITLQAGLKGTLATGSGIVVTASSSVSLLSESGSIGKKPVIVNTPVLVANSTLGSVNVVAQGNVLLGAGSSAGKDFTLDANQMTVTGVLTAGDGSISLTTGNGQLAVASTAIIQAFNGGIVMAAKNVNTGDILIGSNTLITTGGKGGDVIIAIGEPPKKGTNTVNPDPTHIIVTNTGKGQTFFGPGNGVSILAGTTDVKGTNKNVIFNNLSTNQGAHQIILGSGGLIEADPPSRSTSNAVFPSGVSTQAAVDSLSLPVVPRNTSPVSVPNALTGNFDASQIGLSNVNRIDVSTITMGDTTSSVTNNADTGYSSTANDLIVSAAFHSDRDAGQQEFAVENQRGVRMTSAADSVSQSVAKHGTSQRHALTEGNVVFAPSTVTTVETLHGTVKLAAGAVALVMQSDDGLAVYDLHDQGKNDVVIETMGKRISLSPGRHVMVSSHATRDYSLVNPIELVQYRGLSQSKLDNGWHVYTSEFSIPSACYAVKPLNQLMKSKHAEANKLAKRIVKTTAVLMTLNPDRGDFQQFFKSQITAMHR